MLKRFDVWRQAAIDMATADDSVSRQLLAEVLTGESRPFDEAFTLDGDWRCRYLQLGPGAALTVYRWFSCRVEEDDAGTLLEKTTGSQRTRGRLYRWREKQLLYLGALHYDHEAPLRFGERRARDQLALLTRLADGRMRLEFPAPAVDSDFAILEFRR